MTERDKQLLAMLEDHITLCSDNMQAMLATTEQRQNFRPAEWLHSVESITGGLQTMGSVWLASVDQPAANSSASRRVMRTKNGLVASSVSVVTPFEICSKT